MRNPAYDKTHRMLREIVLEAAGYKCLWCGGWANAADHLIPLAEGGTNEIRPVIEGRRAHHQVEGVVGVGQVFGRPQGQGEPVVAGRCPGDLDHGGRWVDAGKLVSLRIAAGQRTEQVTSATPDVEDPPWIGTGRKRQIRGPVGDVVVQAAEPAALAGDRSGVEGGKVAFGLHLDIVAGPTRMGASVA
jgi:hypothetical protein